jgi:signal transduction histidine kinase
MAVEASPVAPPEALQVPFSRVAAFIRQVTHDVRNNLNSLDLQAAYASELITDPEVVAEVRRIRTIIQTSARQLQAISANFQTSAPHFVTYQASILVEDLRDRLMKTFPDKAGEVVWETELGLESLEVDVEMLFSGLMELFRNAFQFRGEGDPVRAYVGLAEGRFFLELRERKPPPATPPETWGLEPFVSSRRSGYGLGLFRVRRTLAAHHGQLTFFYDSTGAELKTRVELPLASSS